MQVKRKITKSEYAKARCLILFLVVYALATASVQVKAQQAEESIPATIIFAGSAGYPPFQWRDQNGVAREFVIDLQQALAAEGDKKAEHRLTKWGDALQAVKSGDADVVALFASEARSKDFAFTQPFYHVAHGIFSHAEGQAFGRLEELSGQVVAVVAGAYAGQRLAIRAGVA